MKEKKLAWVFWEDFGNEIMSDLGMEDQICSKIKKAWLFRIEECAEKMGLQFENGKNKITIERRISEGLSKNTFFTQ